MPSSTRSSSSAPNQYPVFLSDEQRERLNDLCRNGQAPAKKIRHAQVLLLSDRHRPEGRLSGHDIARLLGMHLNTVARIRRKFVQDGEAPALDRKPRETPPTPPILDGHAEAHLVAICCSDPPQGRVCWTLRLLAEELVQRRIVTQISAETVRRVLKKRTQAVAEEMLVHSGTGPGPLRRADGGRARRLRRRASRRGAADLHG